MKPYSKQTLDERLAICLEVISEEYGIELIWQEKLRLKHYLSCCKPLVDKKYLKESIEGAAIHLFMLDTFGLDGVVMQQMITTDYDPKKPEERELYFKDGHERTSQLQAHIRNHIQEWREQRELI
jgi:hypothetical protein